MTSNYTPKDIADNLSENDYVEFVKSLTPAKQERLLTAMMNSGTLSVHVEKLNETFDVLDVYDNSGEASSNCGKGEASADTTKLTILYVAPTE